MKQVSPAQHADAEFRKAVALMAAGAYRRCNSGYETALRLDAGHDAARQALVACCSKASVARMPNTCSGRAEKQPEHTGFAMLLARLQVEHSAVDQARQRWKILALCQCTGDYQAFYCRIAATPEPAPEAIAYYQVALQLAR